MILVGSEILPDMILVGIDMILPELYTSQILLVPKCTKLYFYPSNKRGETAPRTVFRDRHNFDWSSGFGTIVDTNIAENYGVVNSGNGPNKVVQKSNKNDKIENWVRKNPPTESISRDDYFKKYSDENRNPTNKNNLGKILKKVYGDKNIISTKIKGVWYYQLLKTD
jgi:hypothetical protein